MLELLLANANPHTRRVSLNGDEYIVANGTLIVPGVLPGSKGALYYPPEEVQRSVDAWNGMPIVVNHPHVAGVPVSARSPEILAKYGIGTVFASKFGDTLEAELWFNVNATRRVDARILQRLERGEPIELSTGLFTQQSEAPAGAVHNSKTGPKQYTHIARNYRPDHLAILPDQQGACSVRDGCGVLVKNEMCPKCGKKDCGHTAEPDADDKDGKTKQPSTPSQPKKEPSVTKNELVSWLTTNCKCWKGQETTLNGMDEPQLKVLKSDAEEATQNAAVANAAKTGIKHGNLTVNWDGGKFAVTETPVVNNTPTPQPKMTLTQYLSTHGTPEEQAVWNNAVAIEAAARQQLTTEVTALVANEADAGKKAWGQTKLQQGTIAALQEAKLMLAKPAQPTVNAPGTVPALFVTPVPQPVPVNNGKSNSADILPIPTLNLESNVGELIRKRTGG